MGIDRTMDAVQWLAGIAAVIVLVWMSVLSLEADYVLEWHVLIGMLAVIIILLYGVEALENIIETWRGRGD